MGEHEHGAGPAGGESVILLHGFGQRYDLPISVALYLDGAAGVVVISFVLVVLFAGDQVGAKALQYRRRTAPALASIARTPWPRIVGGVIGVAGLLAIVITGFFGAQKRPDLNPAEYLTWIFFWAGLVILSGLVGNLWYLVNPWSAIYDAVAKVLRLRPLFKLPRVGVWPAAAAYFSFACLQLTSGMSNRPWLVAVLALVYSAVTLAGMFLFGRDEWLRHIERGTAPFSIVRPLTPGQ